MLLVGPGLAVWAVDIVGRAFSDSHVLENFAAATHIAPSAVEQDEAKHLAHRDSVPFLQLAYAYLPLVCFGTLAHYEDLMLTELGRAAPIAAATFGYGDVALTGGGLGLWDFVAPEPVVQLMQASAIGAPLLFYVMFKLASPLLHHQWSTSLPSK